MNVSRGICWNRDKSVMISLQRGGASGNAVCFSNARFLLEIPEAVGFFLLAFCSFPASALLVPFSVSWGDTHSLVLTPAVLKFAFFLMMVVVIAIVRLFSSWFSLTHFLLPPHFCDLGVWASFSDSEIVFSCLLFLTLHAFHEGMSISSSTAHIYVSTLSLLPQPQSRDNRLATWLHRHLKLTKAINSILLLSSLPPTLSHPEPCMCWASELHPSVPPQILGCTFFLFILNHICGPWVDLLLSFSLLG